MVKKGLAEQLEYFTNLWKTIGAKSNPQKVFYSIYIASFARAYHNLDTHIFPCIEEFQDVKPFALNPYAIEVGFMFHDIADEPAVSALIAEHYLKKGGCSWHFTNSVKELIQVTDHKTAPRGTDAKIMISLDLLILGRAPEVFDNFDLRQVPNEYPVELVPTEMFRYARLKVLEEFMEKPEIYPFDYFKMKYEGRARDNLTRAIARLKGPQ